MERRTERMGKARKLKKAEKKAARVEKASSKLQKKLDKLEKAGAKAQKRVEKLSKKLGL
jgi:nitroimidazol reductase NimA-like FMN-containing flavoprotein (pyridoxamine 5'-phosphate oxidase superfamily)